MTKMLWEMEGKSLNIDLSSRAPPLRSNDNAMIK